VQLDRIPVLFVARGNQFRVLMVAGSWRLGVCSIGALGKSSVITPRITKAE
jgi:hypothetical protein